jgi:hypothetical protein
VENGVHISFWVSAEDVIIMGGSLHSIKKNPEALVVASKEIGLKVNDDKTKYIVMSRDQNAERSYDMEINDASFYRAVQFKYLGSALTIQDFIQEEIKRILKSGIACFH